MPSPKISICIPTYNGEKYLEEALESVQLQTFRDFEVIVSDDDSSDDTLKIVEKFKEKVDFQVHIFHHKPDGIGANWNNSIRQANGEYIKFLFQDDVLMPNCLEKMLKAFEKHKNLGLIASKRTFILNCETVDTKQEIWLMKYKNLQVQYADDNNDVFLNKSIFKRLDFKKSPLNKIGEPSVVMFRKSIVGKVGWFDVDLKQILDYEYWYRILKKKPILILNEPLVKFRIHPGQETQKNKSKKINDYELYNYILYKNYFWLLNYKYQKDFFFKFNKLGRFIKKIKRRIF